MKQPRSIEWRRKISENNRRRGPRSEATKEKLRLANLGNKASEETKAKMRRPKPHSVEYRANMKIVQRRIADSKQPKNPNSRDSYKYRDWREAVFQRDKYTCQGSGPHGIRLHAHHIKGWDEYPELRYDVENGQTLCICCHTRLHHNKGDMK
jgi:5-methylcytosine-specific restriction endonuclease McrA